MFDNLQNFEAIKIDGNICVRLPRGVYKINGEVLEVNTYNGEQHVFNSEAVIEQQIKTPSVCLYFRNKETDGRLSIDEHQDTLQKIDDKYSQFYSEYDDEYSYSDIDTEYQHKKEVQSFKDIHVPVLSEEEINYEPVDIKVKGSWEDTGSDFIETPYSQGSVSFGSCLFKVHTGKIAWDEFVKQCNKYNLTYSGDNIRFVQVDNGYIFASRYDHIPYIKNGLSVCSLAKSLEDAHKCEAEVREVIAKRMYVLFADQSVSEIQRKQLHNDLSYTLGKIRSLDIKVKASSDKSSIIHKMIGMIKSLEDGL